MGKRSDRRREFYDNMLSDAWSSVSYWWFEASESDGYELPEFDDLTIDHVAKGWQMLINVEEAGKFQCCNDPKAVRNAERSLQCGDDCEDYDACVSDAVIQLALLGEIVYG